MTTTKKAPVKKTGTKKAAAKAAKKADTPTWSTIHIFGYGETQIIGKTLNGKVACTKLKTLEPLIAALAEKQQKGTKVSLEGTHALNIFNGAFIDFLPKPGTKNNAQRLPWIDVNTKLIDKLATELLSNVPEEKQHKHFMQMLRKNDMPVIAKKSARPVVKKSIAATSQKSH